MSRELSWDLQLTISFNLIDSLFGAAKPKAVRLWSSHSASREGFLCCQLLSPQLSSLNKCSESFCPFADLKSRWAGGGRGPTRVPGAGVAAGEPQPGQMICPPPSQRRGRLLKIAAISGRSGKQLVSLRVGMWKAAWSWTWPSSFPA